MKTIQYKKGYKYQTTSDYAQQTDFKLPSAITSSSGFITLGAEGFLLIRQGYAWDGPSGPTIDTLNFMRGSLVHDALYQLMREKLIAQRFKIPADELLHQMCRTDGMCSLRAAWVLKGLEIGGDDATRPANRKKIHTAP